MWEATPFAGGAQLGKIGESFTNPWGKYGQWGYDVQTGDRMPNGGGPNPSWGLPNGGNGSSDLVRLGGQVSAPSGTAVNDYAQPSVAGNQNAPGASSDAPQAPGDNAPATSAPGAPANGVPGGRVTGGAFHPLRNWFGSQRMQLLRRGPGAGGFGAGGFGTLYSTQRRSSLGDGYWSRLNSMGGG